MQKLCCESFFFYFSLRLFPSLKKKYPGKKMILVPDNASYHKGSNRFEDTSIDIRQATPRNDYVTFMNEKKIKSVPIVRTSKKKSPFFFI